MNFLITGAWNKAQMFFEKFNKSGHKVFFLQNEKDNLPCDAEIVDAVICNGLFLYHDIAKFSNLKVIQLTSVGYDRVPMDYVKQKGIKIFNARGVYSIPMAEYAVFGVLSLYKKGKEFYKNQKLHAWEKQRDALEIFGKTVCVVGCGNVGGEVAKRFLSLGCKIIGVDLFEIKNEIFEEKFSVNEIGKALQKSDVVVLTLPLTKETENMFDEKMFSKMKDNSVLVNIARGKIVKEDALIKALNGKLYGAVIDVFEVEPLNETSPLWEIENLIITPHNSFVGDGNNERLNKVILENVL